MEKAKANASKVRHFIILDQDLLRLYHLIVSALGLAGIICAFMRDDEVSLVAEVSSGG